METLGQFITYSLKLGDRRFELAARSHERVGMTPGLTVLVTGPGGLGEKRAEARVVAGSGARIEVLLQQRQLGFGMMQLRHDV